MPRADLLSAAVVRIQDYEFPERLLYDIDNQIWYEPLADGTVRAGFTSWAVGLMGDVLVFTPKRIGKDFEPDKSFAVVEGGKWVGAARAAFGGVVVAHNEALVKKPELLNSDAYGEGWMLIVRPSAAGWETGLVAGAALAPAFEAWLATDAYKSRSG
jgi:glycine cleavage system H protein